VLGPDGVVRVLRSGAGRTRSTWRRWRSRWPARSARNSCRTVAVNAVGEELLWRGTVLDQFPGDIVVGALWPLAGFTVWHLAPQVILPSSRGRAAFLLGAAVVGAACTAVAWRTRGLRNVALPHVLTDACGVRAARFRLGH
jgi:hypothetical protein